MVARINANTGRLDYRGKPMNRAARISAFAKSSQVLCSKAVWQDGLSCPSRRLQQMSVLGVSLGGQAFKVSEGEGGHTAMILMRASSQSTSMYLYICNKNVLNSHSTHTVHLCVYSTTTLLHYYTLLVVRTRVLCYYSTTTLLLCCTFSAVMCYILYSSALHSYMMLYRSQHDGGDGGQPASLLLACHDGINCTLIALPARTPSTLPPATNSKALHPHSIHRAARRSPRARDFNLTPSLITLTPSPSIHHSPSITLNPSFSLRPPPTTHTHTPGRCGGGGGDSVQPGAAGGRGCCCRCVRGAE